MKAIIGITAGHILSNSQIWRVCLIDKYCQAIIFAGGVPVIIPAGIVSQDIPSLLQRFDGLMLTGGGDISVDTFSGSMHSRVSDVQPGRDELEIAIAKLAAETNIPLLGICRGQQVINVALGGDLYTHIPDQFSNAIKHDWFPNIARDYEAHSVKLIENSRLRQILYGSDIMVNSLHHQAVKTLAPALSAVGFAPDNLIEAVELPTHRFFIGVQWHPEWMLNSPAMVNLFREFVQEAGNE